MEDNKQKEKILEKLRKLMDLKNSAIKLNNIGEANAAAGGIMRLLKEYDLTLQDIPTEEKSKDPIGEETIPFKFKYMQYKWYLLLMNTIAEANNGMLLRTLTFDKIGKVEDTQYTVIGRKKNREVILYLISFLSNYFIKEGKNKYEEYKYQYIRRTGRTPIQRGEYMKDFLMGCYIGVRKQFQEEIEKLDKEKVNALVVTNKQELRNFVEDKNVTDIRLRKNTYKNETALANGYETGQNVSIKKGIEGKKQERLK